MCNGEAQGVAEWREGARSGDPADRCPNCGTLGCMFAFDFKKFGTHSLRVCSVCRTVFVDGKRQSELVITK